MNYEWAFFLPALLIALLQGLSIGLIPAAIAHHKGKDFWQWWLFGTVLFIFALPTIILTEPDREALEARAIEHGMRKCPYCAELVKEEADLCKFCRSELPDEDDLLPRVVECPLCGEEISLTAQERITGKFICCECKQTADLSSSFAQSLE